MSKLVVNVTPEFSELLQIFAFSNGWTWPNGSTEVEHENQPYLIFTKDPNVITWLTFQTDIKRTPDTRITSFHTHMDQIMEWIKDRIKPITIGEYTVEFSQSGLTISVGCTTVGFDTVKKIYENMLEIQKNKD
jgi:hypothetical protein